MFDIYVNINKVSPYTVFLILSLLIGYSVAVVLMIKDNTDKGLARLSTISAIALSLYFGVIYTIITSLKSEEIKYNFSSMGGFIGVLLNAFILGKLFKKYKTNLYKAYICVLPLIYAIAKIGCFLVGCCYGIKSNWILSVTYHGSEYWLCTEHPLFPVQIVETVVFFIVFILGYLLIYKIKNKYSIHVELLLCCLLKFMLDYLRDSHTGIMLSTNQVVCLGITIIVIFQLFLREKNASDTKCRVY